MTGSYAYKVTYKILRKHLLFQAYYLRLMLRQGKPELYPKLALLC